MNEKQYPKVDKYVELFDIVREKSDNDQIAIAIFQEILKDSRTEKIQNNKKVVNDNSPATEKQIQYLKRLGSHVPDNLNRKQASELIDKAKQWQESVKKALKKPLKISV